MVGIRNPTASRPWQYVLEPLAGYLTYAQELYAGSGLPPALNFGPPADGARPVREVIERIVARWGAGAAWQMDQSPKVPEAKHLTLDASQAGRILGWRSRLNLDEALDRIVAWHRAYCEGHDMRAYSLKDIAWYQQLQA